MINVKDYGAIGNGTIDDTVACQNALNEAIANKDSVYFPTGTYCVDPLQVGGGDVTIYGDGKQSILKQNWVDFYTNNNFAILQIRGTSGNIFKNVTVRDLCLDGNKGIMTNLHLRTSNMDCINFKYCEDSIVQGVITKNSMCDGIDLDFCENVIVTDTINKDNDGWGIHLSAGSQKNLITNNICYNNGAVKTRGGINQAPLSDNAKDNVYVGNYCYDNYKNYSIDGEGALFEGNRSKNGMVANVYTGATISRSNMKVQNENNNVVNNSTEGSVVTMSGWFQKQGTGGNHMTTNVYFPSGFDKILSVVVSPLGRNATTPANSITAINNVSGNIFSMQTTNVSNTGFTVDWQGGSNTFGTTSYYSGSWIATGVKEQL